jgi:hypothetical protein
MRRAGAPLLAICIAVGLGACGGSTAERSEPTTAAEEVSVTSTATVKDEHAPSPRAKAEDGARGQEKDSGGPPIEEPGGEETDSAGPDPGTKGVAAGVPVQAGGDNSVQVFGVEGEVGEREQALATLRTYLDARAAGNWARACAETSAEFREQLATVVSTSKGDQKPEGCTTTLRVFLGRVPRSTMRGTAEIEGLLSFRVAGDYAYVIFRGADGTVRFIAMVDENGEWKVNTVEPGELPPSD